MCGDDKESLKREYFKRNVWKEIEMEMEVLKMISQLCEIVVVVTVTG